MQGILFRFLSWEQKDISKECSLFKLFQRYDSIATMCSIREEKTMKDNNDFKVGSIIVARELNDPIFSSDIGIILDISDYVYTVHWFQYYDYGKLMLNRVDILVDDDVKSDYKVLK